MTRINVIPVTELSRQHLVAEYREIVRVFALARPVNDAPANYTLGTGHVKFFYDKLAWIFARFSSLCGEMTRRGYNPTMSPDMFIHYMYEKPDLWNHCDWVPSDEALRINRERIRERS